MPGSSIEATIRLLSPAGTAIRGSIDTTPRVRPLAADRPRSCGNPATQPVCRFGELKRVTRKSYARCCACRSRWIGGSARGRLRRWQVRSRYTAIAFKLRTSDRPVAMCERRANRARFRPDPVTPPSERARSPPSRAWCACVARFAVVNRAGRGTGGSPVVHRRQADILMTACKYGVAMMRQGRGLRNRPVGTGPSGRVRRLPVVPGSLARWAAPTARLRRAHGRPGKFGSLGGRNHTDNAAATRCGVSGSVGGADELGWERRRAQLERRRLGWGRQRAQLGAPTARLGAPTRPAGSLAAEA
jgi:hypothetical protein